MDHFVRLTEGETMALISAVRTSKYLPMLNMDHAIWKYEWYKCTIMRSWSTQSWLINNFKIIYPSTLHWSFSEAFGDFFEDSAQQIHNVIRDSGVFTILKKPNTNTKNKIKTKQWPTQPNCIYFIVDIYLKLENKQDLKSC